MSQTTAVSAALEDYLEAILSLERANRPPRVRDIAKALSVHKSTVTAALKTLAEKALIDYRPYEITSLTPKGREIAEAVSQNHRIIQRFLSEVLLLDGETAQSNACRLEHDVDRQVLDRLVLFAKYMKKNPEAGENFVEGFAKYVGELGGAGS